MTENHPNITSLSKLDIRDLDASADLFSDGFVWHYFNPSLRSFEGNYVGVEGMRKFFAALADETGGTFKVQPISAMPFGDELVVVRTRNTMELADKSTAVDIVVVWRIVAEEIAEGWDIPSACTQTSQKN